MADTKGNDCGIYPAQFRGWVKMACRWHDQAYSENSWAEKNLTRKQVDDHFLSQLLLMSGRNVLKIGASYIMYGVTRLLGANWWEGKP